MTKNKHIVIHEEYDIVTEGDGTLCSPDCPHYVENKWGDTYYCEAFEREVDDDWTEVGDGEYFAKRIYDCIKGEVKNDQR